MFIEKNIPRLFGYAMNHGRPPLLFVFSITLLFSDQDKAIINNFAFLG